MEPDAGPIPDKSEITFTVYDGFTAHRVGWYGLIERGHDTIYWDGLPLAYRQENDWILAYIAGTTYAGRRAQLEESL